MARCNRTVGDSGIYQYLDNQALADLSAGKLPYVDQSPLDSDPRGVHFRSWDRVSSNGQTAIETLRQEIPTGAIEEVLVDGISWNDVSAEGRAA
jgi:hypothetical protein